MANILFIGMNFYDYEDAIVDRLEEKGHKVIRHPDKESFFLNHFPFLPEKIGLAEIKKYQEGIIKKLRNKCIDYVLVIVGRGLTSCFLKELRKINENAVFILYLWDDIARVKNFEEVKNYYDKIYTFDPNDAQKYQIGFLPLFYRKKRIGEGVKRNQEIDIFSAMNCHSDREKIAREIVEKNKDKNIKIILTVNGKSYLRRIIKNHFHSISDRYINIRFRKNTLRQEELYQIMQCAKIILDVQYPTQIGLTMRTFDAMSVGRKLITTNPDVRYYDFYDPNNISIIDREDISIPDDFYISPYLSLKERIIDKYSLNTWIEVLLENRKERYLRVNNPYGDY